MKLNLTCDPVPEVWTTSYPLGEASAILDTAEQIVADSIEAPWERHYQRAADLLQGVRVALDTARQFSTITGEERITVTLEDLMPHPEEGAGLGYAEWVARRALESSVILQLVGEQ